MTAYFSIHGYKSETIASAFIFLLSVFYAAVSYEDVYDLAKIEESMETIGEFDEEVFSMWKNEYAHPLVIGHKKNDHQAMLRRRVHEVNHHGEVEQMNFMGTDPEEKPRRNTRLWELSEHPEKQSDKTNNSKSR